MINDVIIKEHDNDSEYFNKHFNFDVGFECTDDCKTTEFKQECNGKCIGANQLCNGACPEGSIFCNASSTCINITFPCGKRCLSSKYPKFVEAFWPSDNDSCSTCLDSEWFCNNECIRKTFPCNEKCSKEYNYCKEENKCIQKNSVCGDKCLDPAFPIWSPWKDECTTKEKCRSENYKYLCNGICIPVIIPCNSTCLEKTHDSHKLFGPTSCTKIPFTSPFINIFNTIRITYRVMADNSDNIWAKSTLVDFDRVPILIKQLGNSDSQLGVCLPGNVGCNGTCSLDPEKNLAVEFSNEGIYSKSALE